MTNTTNKQKITIKMSGFFKWFFCGCEVTNTYTYKNESEDKTLLQEPLKKYEKEIHFDDLTIIEGIGPVIRDILNKNGITSFKDVSVTNVDELKRILDMNSLSGHDPTTWPEQAKLAYCGSWEELEKWQDELIGGRKK